MYVFLSLNYNLLESDFIFLISHSILIRNVTYSKCSLHLVCNFLTVWNYILFEFFFHSIPTNRCLELITTSACEEVYYAQSLFLYLIITLISILTCPRKSFWMIYPLRVFILLACLLLQIIKIYYEWSE